MRMIYVDFDMARQLIRSEHDQQVTGMLDGFAFFEAWHADWMEAFPGVRLSEKNRHFLHFITWTEMKVHVTGALLFMRRRFTDFPDSCLVPRRWSTSVIESLFSRIRGMSNGHGGMGLEQYIRRVACLRVRHENGYLRLNPVLLNEPTELMRLSRPTDSRKRKRDNAQLGNVQQSMSVLMRSSGL